MAYNITQFARPVSLKMTTAAGVITVTEIVDWGFTDGTGVEYKAGGKSQYKRSLITALEPMLTCKTSDAGSAWAGLKVGQTVSAVELLIDAPYVGDAGGTSGTVGLQHGQRLKIAMDYGVVEGAADISGNADGGAAEYEIKIKAVRKPDGTDPVVTRSIGVFT